MKSAADQKGMSDKERVLQVWPDAVAIFFHGAREYSIWERLDPPGKSLTYYFDTEEEAWADAASKLPAAVPEPTRSAADQKGETTIFHCPDCGNICESSTGRGKCYACQWYGKVVSDVPVVPERTRSAADQLRDAAQEGLAAITSLRLVFESLGSQESAALLWEKEKQVSSAISAYDSAKGEQ